MSKELASRLLIGPLIAGITLGLLGLDMVWQEQNWGSWALGTIVVVAASFEFAKLLKPIAPAISPWLLIITNALIIGEAYPGLLPASLAGKGLVLLVSVGLVIAALLQMAKHGLDHFVQNLTATVFGMVYIGVATHLLVALNLLGSEDNPIRGTQLVVLAIAAAKFGDTFAYFGGRAFGKHKLCPSISPGKTWEGFLISLIGSVAGTFLFDWVLSSTTGYTPLPLWWHAIVWGLILGPLGALGDLVESCLKRSVDAKDSGKVLMGFGGFLDVFDAVFLIAPVAYILAQLLS